MKTVLSVQTMRESDAATIQGGIPSRELMASAAKGVFDALEWKGKIGIVCGKGNNAGDGFALALLLKEAGKDVAVYLLSEEFSPDGKYYYDLCVKDNITIKHFDDSSVFNENILVDCIFGTGFKEVPCGIYLHAIMAINKSKAKVVSVDINSGLEGNNGLGLVFVKSDLTVSIGSFKYGHFLGSAKDAMKKHVNADIGITPLHEDAFLLEEEDVKSFFRPRKNRSNKGTYGYVGILGGSSSFPGAVKLASLGQQALYAGAGVSKVIVGENIADFLFPIVLETTIYAMPVVGGAMLYDETRLNLAMRGLKVLAVGPGWGVNSANRKILAYLIRHFNGSLVIDADGLNNLAMIDKSILNESKAKIILTPHLKEFSRLNESSIAQVEEDPFGSVKEFVSHYNVTLLLKGPTTIIADKNKVYFSDTGCPGMATAGSGDVLTGILTGILGQNDEDVTFATAVAAFVNGKAGEMAAEEFGDIGMVSSDTARCVSKVIKRYSR